MTVRVAEVTRDSNPAREMLRRGLAQRGIAPGPDVDAAAQALSTRVLDASRTAVLHTWAFTRIASQVTGRELHPVNPDAYETWRALLAKHVGGFAAASREVRISLEGVGLLSPSAPDTLTVNQPALNEPAETDDMGRDGRRLVALAEQQETAARALFAVAPKAEAIDVEASLRALAAYLHDSERFSRYLLERRLPNPNQP